LRWAVRSGQLQNLQKGALLIFDEEEPVGQRTDQFPPREPPGRAQPPGAPHSAPPAQQSSPTSPMVPKHDLAAKGTVHEPTGWRVWLRQCPLFRSSRP
jgi:hypothetical protein